MKIMLLNGSPHINGCSHEALQVMSEVFKNENFETEEFYIGTEPISPCKSCFSCAKIKKCVTDDKVNSFIKKMENCDALIIASPVHYASASGIITTFLDRAFFVSYMGNDVFSHKPAAAIVNARRAGTTATFDQLNKYFTISQMPIISGKYWNMTHGVEPKEIYRDKEGIQNLQIVARNMIYFLKCQEIGKKYGIYPPKITEKIEVTNFIR